MCGVATSHTLEALGTYLEVLVSLEEPTNLGQTLERTRLTFDRIDDQDAPVAVQVRLTIDRARRYLAQTKS